MRRFAYIERVGHPNVSRGYGILHSRKINENKLCPLEIVPVFCEYIAIQIHITYNKFSLCRKYVCSSWLWRAKRLQFSPENFSNSNCCSYSSCATNSLHHQITTKNNALAFLQKNDRWEYKHQKWVRTKRDAMKERERWVKEPNKIYLNRRL